MNQITVNFGECESESGPPANGYNIQYRVLGSVGAYTDAGNFSTSPAEFLDTTGEPAGTDYEGVVRSDCGCESGESGDCYGNDVPWEAIWESAGDCDNSSCGTMISQETTATGYVNLGLFALNVCGSSHVDLSWTVYDRPNRFTLYDNGTNYANTGWVGNATYAGPWGAPPLNTPNTGVIGFNPIAGHIYELRVEVGNADPDNPVNDNFDVQITCTP